VGQVVESMWTNRETFQLQGARPCALKHHLQRVPQIHQKQHLWTQPISSAQAKKRRF
jgi:hypothetical protein